MKDKELIYLEKLGYSFDGANLFKDYGNGKIITIDEVEGKAFIKKYLTRPLDVNNLKDLMTLTYVDRYLDNKKIEIDKVYRYEDEEFTLDIKDRNKAIIVIPTRSIEEYLTLINRFLFNEFPLFQCLIDDGIETISFLNTLYSKKEDKIIFNEHIVTVEELINNYKINDSTHKNPIYFLKEVIKQQENMAEKVDSINFFKFKIGSIDNGYFKLLIEFKSSYVIIKTNDYQTEPKKITSKKLIKEIKRDICSLCVQDWNPRYTSETPYSDYSEWSLSLTFENYGDINITGVNSYPKNFLKLVTFLKKNVDDFMVDLIEDN